MRTYIVAVISSAILCLAAYALGLQNPPTHHKVLTPEQQAYQQWEARYRQLQAQGKQIFAAEMAREKAGDCPNANATADFDVCYGKQVDATEANLKSFEATIHDLLVPAPQTPGESVAPAAGPSGPAQPAAEFESVEKTWRQYRDTACAAAHHEFDGGSGGASFEMQCRIQLARDHMRELRMIYGESFL